MGSRTKPYPTGRIVPIWALAVGLGCVASAGIGCVQVSADKPLVSLGGEPEPQRIDTSKVPPTRSHEEARQKLAEAYARIDYLERRVAYLEDKVAETKADLKRAKKQRDEYKDYKEGYERYKKKYEECKRKYEKLKKRLDD